MSRSRSSSAPLAASACCKISFPTRSLSWAKAAHTPLSYGTLVLDLEAIAYRAQ